MPTLIIVQARLNSNRLPNKSIRKIKGKPLVYYLLKRLELSKLKTILAVPERDHPIFARELKGLIDVNFFLGDASNVLSRYYACSEEHPDHETIIRVTADNPFTSIFCLKALLKKHQDGGFDYSYFTEQPWGTGVEIIKKSILHRAYKEAGTEAEKEHVTLYLRNHKERFKIFNGPVPSDYNHPKLRLTIDFLSDFERTEKIIETYYKNFSNDIVPVLFIIKNQKLFFKKS